MKRTTTKMHLMPARLPPLQAVLVAMPVEPIGWQRELVQVMRLGSQTQIRRTQILIEKKQKIPQIQTSLVHLQLLQELLRQPSQQRDSHGTPKGIPLREMQRLSPSLEHAQAKSSRKQNRNQNPKRTAQMT